MKRETSIHWSVEFLQFVGEGEGERQARKLHEFMQRTQSIQPTNMHLTSSIKCVLKQNNKTPSYHGCSTAFSATITQIRTHYQLLGFHQPYTLHTVCWLYMIISFKIQTNPSMHAYVFIYKRLLIKDTITVTYLAAVDSEEPWYHCRRPLFSRSSTIYYHTTFRLRNYSVRDHLLKQ